MNEENGLSLLHPIRSVGILYCSPAYRIAVYGRRKRRIAAAVLWAVLVTALWILTAIPLSSFSGINGGEAEAVDDAILYVFATARSVTLFVMIFWAGLAGARAFAPEKRGGAMEQLVSLPISRAEIVLSRMLSAMLPLLPALLVAACLDWILCPFFPDVRVYMVQSAVVNVLGLAAALFACCLGLVFSLPMTTIRGLLAGIYFSPCCALTPYFFSAIAARGTFDNNDWAGIWMFFGLYVLGTPAVIGGCVRFFDPLALDLTRRERGEWMKALRTPRTP